LSGIASSASQPRSDDLRGVAVERNDADVDVALADDHAHFGALAGRGAFNGILLRERRVWRDVLPDGVVHAAIDDRAFGSCLELSGRNRWRCRGLRENKGRKDQRRAETRKDVVATHNMDKKFLGSVLELTASKQASAVARFASYGG
jgi:hypothetical protein